MNLFEKCSNGPSKLLNRLLFIELVYSGLQNSGQEV